MSTTIEVLPIDKIVPAGDNPRLHMDGLIKLAASIKERGVLQMPTVTPRGDGYHLMVMGHRRLAAAKLAGLTELECKVKIYEHDEDRFIDMLAENIGRESLSPLEEARGFDELAKRGYSQRKIADVVSAKQPHVAKRLQLLQLPESVQALVDKGASADSEGITIGDALELVKVAHIDGAVEKAVKRADSSGGYYSIGRVVAETLADAERAQKVAAATDKLRAAGVTVVPSGSFYGERSKIRRLDDYGWNVDAKKHASLECHAAAVDNYAHVVLVCTKPSNHMAAKRKESAAAKAKAEAELVRRREELAEAKEARLEVMRATLARRAVPKGALGLLAGVVLHGDMYGYEYQEIACGLLGIVLPKVEGRRPTYNVDDLLRTFINKAPGNDVKVAIALTLGLGEEDLDGDYPQFDSAIAANHFAFLEGLGYQRRPIELLVKKSADAG